MADRDEKPPSLAPHARSEERPGSIAPPSIRMALRDDEPAEEPALPSLPARAKGFRLEVKAALVLTGTILAMVLLLYVPMRALLVAQFEALERRQAEVDLERARVAFADELQTLKRSAYDYSAWDDPYDYLGGQKPAFVEDNLFDGTFDQQGWTAFVMTNAKGDVVFSKFYDVEAKRETPPDEALVTLARTSAPLRPTVRSQGTQGVLFAGDRAWLVATHPVVPSTREEAARGILLVARVWEPTARKRVAAATQLDVTLAPAVADAGATSLTAESDDVLRANVRVDGIEDVAGSGPGILAFPLDRALAREGHRNALVVLAVMIAAGASLAAAILIALRRVVLRRLAVLSNMARRVRDSHDLTLRSRDMSADELGVLGRSFDSMLARIERLMGIVEAERATSDSLLLNVMPEQIALRLKGGEHPIADAHANVTVIFADLVGFTKLASTTGPDELVEMLGELFTEFDGLTERYEVEKIKTIGDAYMAASGLLHVRPDHCEVAIRLALRMIERVAALNERRGTELAVRIGLHSGPVVAGVIGERRFVYDIWGDTVNTASRMESTGLPNRVQVSSAAYEQAQHAFEFEARSAVSVKGKGEMSTYLVSGVRSTTMPPPKLQASGE